MAAPPGRTVPGPGRRPRDAATLRRPFQQMVHASEPRQAPQTLAQREFLLPTRPLETPGFAPRRCHQLASKQRGPSELRGRLRQHLAGPRGPRAPPHTWGFHTWLDVGRLPLVLPARPDRPYDSNVWRRLTRSPAAAPAAPPVPPPSVLGPHSLLTFIRATPLFVDGHRRKQVIARTVQELREVERLKLRSEVRAPPLDAQGNILPPAGYKKPVHVSAGGRRCPGDPLLPTPLPSPAVQGWPCPNPLPHYQEKMTRLAYQPSPTLSRGLLDDYQGLLPGRVALPLYPRALRPPRASKPPPRGPPGRAAARGRAGAGGGGASEPS